MTHIDEGLILALRDDAAADADAETLAHLEGCSECREALEASRTRQASVLDALGALDEPAWDTAGAREQVRLRVAEAAARTAGTESLTARRARKASWSLSRAAGILLVTAAGLSALPGSPVRNWIAGAGGDDEPTVAPLAETAPTAAAEMAEEAGVRLPVTAGPLAVVLRDAAPGTEIQVRWVPGGEAAVFARAGSRFTSGQGRMEAQGLDGVVRVELPRSIVPVSLEVNGRILLRSTAEGVDVSGPVVERSSESVTFRIPD